MMSFLAFSQKEATYPNARLIGYDQERLSENELAKFSEILASSKFIENLNISQTTQIEFRNSVILWVFPNAESKRVAAQVGQKGLKTGQIKVIREIYDIDEDTRKVFKTNVLH